MSTSQQIAISVVRLGTDVEGRLMGLENRFVPRRDKPAHAIARRLDWGANL